MNDLEGRSRVSKMKDDVNIATPKGRRKENSKRSEKLGDVGLPEKKSWRKKSKKICVVEREGGEDRDSGDKRNEVARLPTKARQPVFAGKLTMSSVKATIPLF